jgi:hypothetical protein
MWKAGRPLKGSQASQQPAHILDFRFPAETLVAAKLHRALLPPSFLFPPKLDLCN